MLFHKIFLLMSLVQSPVLFATGRAPYSTRSQAVRILNLYGDSGSYLIFLNEGKGSGSIEFKFGSRTFLVRPNSSGNVSFEQTLFSRGHFTSLSSRSKQGFRILAGTTTRFFADEEMLLSRSDVPSERIFNREVCELNAKLSNLKTIDLPMNYVGPSCGELFPQPEFKSAINETVNDVFSIKGSCTFEGNDLAEGIRALKEDYEKMTLANQFPITCGEDINTFSDIESGQTHMTSKLSREGALEVGKMRFMLTHEVAHLVIYRACRTFRLKAQDTSGRFFGRTLDEVPSCAAFPDEDLARRVSIRLRKCAEGRGTITGWAVADQSINQAPALSVVDQLIPVNQVADAAAMAKHEEGLRKVAEALDGKGDLATEVKTLAAASSFGIKGPDNPFGVPEAPVRRAAEKMGRLVSSAGFPGSIMERVANAVLGSPPASAKPESQVQGGTQVRAPATVDIPGVQYRSPSEPSAVESNSDSDPANMKDSRNDAQVITSGTRSKSISGPTDNSEKLASTKLVGKSAGATNEVRSGDKPNNLTQMSRVSSGGGLGSGEGGSAGGRGSGEPSRGEQEPSRVIDGKPGNTSRVTTEKFAQTLNGIKRLDFERGSASVRSPAGASSATEVNQFLTWARSHEPELNSSGVQINYKSKSEKLESIGSTRPRFNYLLRCDSQSCKLILVNSNGPKNHEP